MRIKDIAYVKTGLNKANKKASAYSKEYTLFFQLKDVNCFGLLETQAFDVKVQEKAMHLLVSGEHLLLAKGKKPVCLSIGDYQEQLTQRKNEENQKFANDYSAGNWGKTKQVVGYSCSSDFLIMTPKKGCENILALVACWLNTREGQKTLLLARTSKPSLRYITKSSLEMINISKLDKKCAAVRVSHSKKWVLSKIEAMNKMHDYDREIQRLFEG